MPAMIAAAGIGAAGSLGGGALSFMGASSQSKAIRQAMDRYLQYIQEQRGQFLGATAPIRAQLEKYAQGDISADTRQATINENYGSSLNDLRDSVLQSGVQPGGTYTPGNRDRTTMLMGQNLAASRAQNMRDLSMADQQMGLSYLPTYEVGTPAATVPSPDVFGAGAPPSIGSFLGQSISSFSAPFANAAAYGPIAQQLYGLKKPAKTNPVAAANYDNSNFYSQGRYGNPALTTTNAPGWS